MASGDSLVSFIATDGHPPAAAFGTPATLDVRNGHPVIDFDQSAAEWATFESVLPRHYAAGGITIRLGWMASSATSGAVRWVVYAERLASTLDLDADNVGTPTAVNATTAGTSGQVTYTDLAIAQAEVDAVAGEAFRIFVARSGADAADTMTGDAELLSVELRET